MNVSYLVFGLKPAVFGCFTNATAPPPIAPVSCSMVQIDWPVFSSAGKNNFFGWGLHFFVSDVLSEVVLGPFWLMLPGLVPNH